MVFVALLPDNEFYFQHFCIGVDGDNFLVFGLKIMAGTGMMIPKYVFYFPVHSEISAHIPHVVS